MRQTVTDSTKKRKMNKTITLDTFADFDRLAIVSLRTTENQTQTYTNQPVINARY